MSQKAKNSGDLQSSVAPITSPSGLNINPSPPKPRRVSKRAASVIGVFVLLLLLAFAYGGYKRTEAARFRAGQSGFPHDLSPATSAENEFVNAIPQRTAIMKSQTQTGRLVPPSTDGCSVDPNTGRTYRYDPFTGYPCHGARRASSRHPPISQSPRDNLNRSDLDEQRRQDLARREQEAMQAPTAVHFASSELSHLSRVESSYPGSQGDLAQATALSNSLGGDRGNSFLPSLTAGGLGEYESQNMQSRKEQFLESASAKQMDDYLKSTRLAPLSQYEIKAGWEIPAVLEQSLNSDLPGEIKALILSNVYDTATGQYLLIPQGARLVGKYDAHVAYGQDGVQVVWNRIIFPDASSVDLFGMIGLDSHGNAGLRDKVDRHYKRLFGFAALTSAFTAAFEVSQRRNKSVLTTPSASETASSAVGQELSQTGAQITRRNLNVQPTIKVPAGYKFTVRVDRDIFFESSYTPSNADPSIVPSQKELRKHRGM